jgi:hypothetical protein
VGADVDEEVDLEEGDGGDGEEGELPMMVLNN